MTRIESRILWGTKLIHIVKISNHFSLFLWLFNLLKPVDPLGLGGHFPHFHSLSIYRFISLQIILPFSAPFLYLMVPLLQKEGMNNLPIVSKMNYSPHHFSLPLFYEISLIQGVCHLLYCQHAKPLLWPTPFPRKTYLTISYSNCLQP